MDNMGFVPNLGRYNGAMSYSAAGRMPARPVISHGLFPRFRYNRPKAYIQTERTVLTTWNYQQTHFVTSAPDIRHLPSDTGIEVAFAGRSNAGKSSALRRVWHAPVKRRVVRSLSTCLKSPMASVLSTCRAMATRRCRKR